MKQGVRAVFLFALCLWSFSAANLFADKGQLWPVPVDISEPSQKAIILHNGLEEILILGTEIAADQEIGILEFIPFPSEPNVSLAEGNPFEAASRLIEKKGLQFVEQSKGGEEIAPVEVRFSGQVGLHDVAVVQIRDLAGFSDWVRSYFNSRGIDLTAAFDTAYANAADYISRGFDYFVFDYVPLASQSQSIKPLVYRFESSRLYYPFKTSNITGKEGTVDLILFLPGSLGLLTDRSDTTSIYSIFNVWPNWDLSSSAKVYPNELAVIWPGAQSFFSNQKIYLQVLKYSGAYDFRNDLLLDVSRLAPFPYKHILYKPDYGNPLGGKYSLVGNLSRDELADVAEAYAKGKDTWYFDPEILSLLQK
jgi:hypothetical protein